MAVVPAGEYWMGRTRLWLMDEIGWQLRDRADDRPVHRVVLNAFAIDAHEVTNAEYASLAAAAKVTVPYHWGGPRPQAGKEQHPVYNVSWFDASKVCAAQGKRLPTEAEWEKAARGGVADTDYPWGTSTKASPPSRRGGRCVARTAHRARGRCPSARLPPMVTASTTCQAICGSGCRTGTTSTTTRRASSRIRRVRARGSTR